MKTKYLFMLSALSLMISCNKATDDGDGKKQIAGKSVVMDESVAFLNHQTESIQYQIDAIKLGNERIANPEIKKYLNANLPKLYTLLDDFKKAAKDKSGTDVPKSDTYKSDLYKLTIADAKEFDDIFVLYYKDFLNKMVKELGSVELHNEKMNALKNSYGNVLYEQKLYFDVNGK